ncbi:MAG: helix-turn-helix transcriptional regulator [Deltaproteobacteria bacterium]|nr:helix-turn-helix transcriptional regulator [Deltaproteobacteria bacterium]
MTLAEFAELLEKAKETVSRYENDHLTPGIEVLTKWAELTGRSMHWLAAGHELGEAAPAEVA